MTQQKYLILIVGPTAVGKTDLCVKLAKELKCDIFSCDSRQFYKEMSIGTAKPTEMEQAGVKHHFIDHLSITDAYTVADFEKEALAALEETFETHQYAIMTGGSGLFAKAITHGFDHIPETPAHIREELMQRLETDGMETLQQQLMHLDPDFCETADIHNKQRVIRALEICLATGKPFSSFRIGETAERPFEILKIGLDRPREELYSRINHRVDIMLAEGLVKEVENLTPYTSKNALQTVGYKEVFEYLAGQSSYEEMVRLIKRNTRRYAKRQLTWFRNQDNFTWFNPSQIIDIKEFIYSYKK